MFRTFKTIKVKYMAILRDQDPDADPVHDIQS
jgi:hypothetical protein